ncbi:MAG: uroporphyrinogen decarboxylase family protein [Planctomycetota bacterium]|nr:uroporphyrinogen decarboxylase family protein [Planctomycetota bacterium]
MSDSVPPLSLEQMCNAVERRGGDIPRVPLGWVKFFNHQTSEKYGQALRDLSDSIVDDVVNLRYIRPGHFQAPEGTSDDYIWAIEPDPGDLAERGFTSRLVVSSTDLIDSFIESMPSPDDRSYFESARQAATDHHGHYCLAWDFFCLFEQAWFLFGMENILCEMMQDPARMKRLFRAFTDYHKKVMDHYADAGAHGYFTSDDLGGQRALLFSRELLLDLYLPFYEELVDYCHQLGMHFWFHTDGEINEIADDLVSIGMDVLHPIQDCMDLSSFAEKYRGRVSYHVGMDIQELLPKGSVEDVAKGTRDLIDLFDREEGGCILAASNGIMPETPLENIEAFLRTAVSYGAEKRQSY